MKRAHNFCPGPCILPESVLRELSDELFEFDDSGMSLIEMSHRSGEYDDVHNATVDGLRGITGAPDDFQILLLQGGASLQFAMVPQNLLTRGVRAAYALSGAWADKAYEDASLVGDTYVAWSAEPGRPTRMPIPSEVELEDGTAFLHLTSNETIGGARVPSFEGFDVPLVADMSSDYLTRPIDWDRFDLVYGGVQKNLGPAGLAVVFVRSSVLDRAPENLPSYLRYQLHANSNSLANTPPMFSIWAMSKVLSWMQAQGGLTVMEQRAAERSALIYEAIDNSDGFYRNPVEPAFRSHTNIVFRLPDEQAETDFVAEAAAESLVNLKGHRSVGGIRASVYNGLPTESVEALVAFMGHFAGSRG